jgi:hypothetical protein
MKKYPREFDRYWSYANVHAVGTLEPWQSSRLKRLAYNAWMAGRRHQKKERYG